MASLRMRMVLIIIGLLFPLPHSFVIRKRSVVGSYDFLKEESKSDDPEPEEDWIIPGQQRSRSELLFDPFSRGIYVSRGPERSVHSPLDRLTIPPRPDEEDEDYRLGDEDDLGFNGGGYDGGPGLIPDEEQEENDGEGEAEGGTKLLNKSELKSMFEKDSTGEEGKVPSPPGHRHPTGGSSSKELTKKDVAELLGPPESPKKSGGGLRQQQQHLKEVVGETRVLVGAAAAASANGSAVAAPSSYEGVRVIEVTESDPDGQTRTQKQTQWLLSPPAGLLGPNEGSPAPMAPGGDDDDEGWRLGNSVFGGGGGGGDEVQRVTRKVKRSELSTPEEDEEEAAAEQNDVELLKTYIRLQTEENRHLEQALNFAISTQVENSDAYLAGEIDQLRLAVENEESLETIRTAIRRRQLRQENGPEEDGEGEEEEEREEEREEEEEGNGDVEREEEEEEEERRMIDDDAAFAKTLLKAKLKKFLVDSAVEDLRERAYEDELEAREGGGGGEEDEEGEEEGEDAMFPKAKVLNPFTRQALGEYRSTKRNEERDEAAEFVDDVEAMPRDADDLDITDLLDTPVPTETGYCPVVQQLTDDCAAARSQRLVLDAEALSLCNRHQICYLCGPVFGMTRDSCDRGYLGESERLCSGGEQCTSEAVGLYLVMAKAHRLTAAPSPAAAFGAYDVCAADCVYDYIVGESDDRR